MDRRMAVFLALACYAFLASGQNSLASNPAAPVPDPSRTPIQAIAVSPYDQIYAGTFGNGLFASFDGGRTWASRNGGLTNKNVFAIAAKSRQTVFVGTFGGGVYRSEGGRDWVGANEGMNSREVVCLDIDARGRIYAGTSTGQIFCSQDDGQNWTLVGDIGGYVNAIAINRDGEILAGTSHGIFLSETQGKEWSKADKGLTCQDVWSLTLNANGHVFAATNGGGVYRSTDNGSSWREVNAGLTNRNAGSVAVCPNGNLFVGTTEGVFVSRNDGDSWNSFVADPSNTSVRCLTIGFEGQLLVGTHWVDLFETNPVQPVPEEAEDGV